jgi:hypothetical protein
MNKKKAATATSGAQLMPKTNHVLDLDVTSPFRRDAELMHIDESEARRMRAAVSENLVTAVKVRSAADLARQTQGEFNSISQVEAALLKSCDTEAQVRRLNQITHEASLEIMFILIDGMERIKRI